YRTARGEHSAVTTVEAVDQDGELRLYNTRRLRTYRDEREIARIVDALCRQGVHVERWLPKAGLSHRTFDLRIVVIGGRVKHTVVRLNRGPITNLHLGSMRQGPERVRARMGPDAWENVSRTAEAAMACFSGSLYAGLDVLVAPDFEGHAVLEVNAFGDQ